MIGKGLKVKKRNNTIPIFFAVDDGYIPFLAVAIESILAHASKENYYLIKILYTNISDKNKRIIKKYENDIYISIMNQYTPLEQVKNIPELNRRVTDKEYNEVVDYAIDLGVVNGFIQEGGTAEESFIPQFDFSGINWQKRLEIPLNISNTVNGLTVTLSGDSD